MLHTTDPTRSRLFLAAIINAAKEFPFHTHPQPPEEGGRLRFISQQCNLLQDEVGLCENFSAKQVEEIQR
jgi:hypothetical protein